MSLYCFFAQLVPITMSFSLNQLPSGMTDSWLVLHEQDHLVGRQFINASFIKDHIVNHRLFFSYRLVEISHQKCHGRLALLFRYILKGKMLFSVRVFIHKQFINFVSNLVSPMKLDIVLKCELCCWTFPVPHLQMEDWADMESLILSCRPSSNHKTL